MFGGERLWNGVTRRAFKKKRKQDICWFRKVVVEEAIEVLRERDHIVAVLEDSAHVRIV